MMTPTQIKLLRRARPSNGEIVLSDDMGFRLNEIGAINNLKRMGYVTLGDRPKVPGPPEGPMYVITEAGREALATLP